MPVLQTLPRLWLFSDARNRETLLGSIAKLPSGSGIVFRDYDLNPEERLERFRRVSQLASAYGHIILVAGEFLPGEDEVAEGGHNRAPGSSRLQSRSVHDEAELDNAIGSGANLIFISPIFPTESHPGDMVLGIEQAIALAKRAPMPSIALGGMTQMRFDGLREQGFYGWGAVGALSL